MTDEYSLTVRREIAAPAEELFDAWLDAESLGAWLRPSPIRETRAETDPQVGGTFRIVMVRDDDDSLLHTGTYREIERPHRLVFTWSSPATGHRETLVTVTFEALPGSTIVEIHQVGLPDEAAQRGHREGWTDGLRELEHFSTAGTR